LVTGYQIRLSRLQKGKGGVMRQEVCKERATQYFGGPGNGNSPREERKGFKNSKGVQAEEGKKILSSGEKKRSPIHLVDWVP